MELATVALAARIPTFGADFRLALRSRGRRCRFPPRGDRDGEAHGKTAVAGPWPGCCSPRPRASSWRWARRTAEPPSRPPVHRSGHLVARGGGEQHAARLSGGRRDHGLTTVGARRAGGGSRRAVTTPRPGGRRTGGLLHPGSSSWRGAGRRSRRSPGTQASWSCRPPRRPSTWAATWARTASCGRTSWLLPWRATHPGPKTFPRSVLLFGATWTMRRSS